MSFRSASALLVATTLTLITAVASPAFASPARESRPAPTSPPPPLEVYGALPATELVELSPSGRRVALITVIGEERRIVLVDLAQGKALGSSDIAKVKVRDMIWVGEDHVLIVTSTMESLPELGIIRRELSLGQIFDPGRQRITALLGADGDLFPAMMGPTEVLTTEAGPGIFVRAHSFRNPRGQSLYRVDPSTGRVRQAEYMSRDVQDYILDPFGRSAAHGEYDEVTKVWSLHLRQDGRLREVWRTTAPVDTPGLIGLGMNGDSVIVAADRPDLSREGREDAEFFNVNLETGVWRPVRFEFDPDALLFHPVTRRLIGATRLEDEGRLYAFADPQAGELWANIEAFFPDSSPSIVSWSDDLRSAVVFTSGPGDAGSYHLLDLANAALTTIGQTYGAIPADQVAPVAVQTYKAADGLEIHGYLTTPPGREARNLPLVVLAHGGPASRDVNGFDWWAQALASRGYAVLQANFRGSTGYGEAFMEAGYGEWGGKMQTDLSDGVRRLVEQGVVDPKRVCIVGASYGGYAALAGPTLDPGVYRCAVSVAGVSDLRRMIAYAAGRGERRDNQTVRYWNRFMGGDGPGDRSLDARSPAQLAERADAPILLIHGKDDTVVPIDQSRMMATALRRAGKPVELVELDGEDHWLSRGDTRTRMLAETVRFLQANNPPD